MTNDEKKILTHLRYRSGRSDSIEIKGAWEFEDFDAALSSLVEKGFVSKVHYKNKKGYSCKLMQAGIDALKEE